MKKKSVCIVTVYNSENCGSFLQAYSLQKTVRELGYDAAFLKRSTHGTTHSLSEAVARVAKNYLCGRFKKANIIAYRYREFAKAQKMLHEMSFEKSKSADCVIIGSDTLWNFDIPYFAQNYAKFTGALWDGTKKATYAISCANAELEKFTGIPDCANSICKLDEISVRDRHTSDIVKAITGKEPALLCDPTLLLKPEQFDIFPKVDIPNKYLAFYYFGEIPKELAEWAKGYAGAKGLEIVTIGGSENITWCKRVENVPGVFVQYMKNADCIVTNTFHGTLFSALFERQFAAYTDSKIKVKELLSELSIPERCCSDIETLNKTFEQRIEYTPVREAISSLREYSLDWLKKLLGEN